MTPELKAKWIAALRSGEYPQGRKRLKSSDGYCCLGVLCAITGNNTDLEYRSYPSEVTLRELQLSDDNAKALADMNDGTMGCTPHSFEEIAAFISKADL